MTGKGDRWGRDRLGRSAPAFLSANISALPPPPCTARREAGRRWSAAVVFAAPPANWWPSFVSSRPEPDGESAGCVCLQCLFSGLCACHLCLPCPLPSSFAPFSLLCPRSSFISLVPCSCHVRQDRQKSKHHVCKLQDCPVGSCNTGLQWRPVRRFISDSYLFSCRVHDPGP